MGIRKTAIALRCPGEGGAVFNPGQTVEGELVFHIVGHKPHRVSHVLVKVRGSAVTHWTTTSGSGDNETTTTHTETQKLVYQDLLLSDLVAKHYGELRLPPGEHRLPFSFTLALCIPPSMRIGDGKIKYFLKGRTISSSFFSLNGKTIFNFDVHQYLDLNDNPDLGRPLTLSGMTDKPFLGKSVGQYHVHMNKKGYVPGETIQISIDGSRELLQSLEKQSTVVKLKQHHVCRAGSDSRGGKKTLLMMHPQNWGRVELVVPGDTRMSIHSDLCRIITVSHYIKIKSKYLKLRLPITIGTVPVQPN